MVADGNVGCDAVAGAARVLHGSTLGKLWYEHWLGHEDLAHGLGITSLAGDALHLGPFRSSP